MMIEYKLLSKSSEKKPSMWMSFLKKSGRLLVKSVGCHFSKLVTYLVGFFSLLGWMWLRYGIVFAKVPQKTVTKKFRFRFLHGLPFYNLQGTWQSPGI